jgi:2-polyprenyl-6-methoxyphenol hydroxylase-like FAD-dependent oxidoreductase
MPSSAEQVLIVGAGPTGLAAALFLAERGVKARLIDRAEGPATTSRARVVNPRSFDLLKATGVAATMMAEARPVRGVRFSEHWRPLVKLEFANLPSSYPMAALPQARTEALLADALEARGLKAEREIAFEGLSQDDDGVEATLVHADGRREAVQTRVLLAADGAHSDVRKALGLAFTGSGYPEPWPLYDVRLNDPLDLDHAHVSFVTGGLVFLLGVSPGLWRVFGNVAEPLDHLPAGTRRGEVLWQSSFHIAHRVAPRAVIGRVALAGDAAHIHSPVGARGMNLGIEDAFIFAQCAADRFGGRPGRLADYGRLRRPLHKSVVRRMELLTTLARGRPPWVGHLRHVLMPMLVSFGPSTRVMQRFITGLDHPVEPM